MEESKITYQDYETLSNKYESLKKNYKDLKEKYESEKYKFEAAEKTEKELREHNNYLLELCMQLQEDLVTLGNSIDLKIQDSVGVQKYIRKIKPKTGTSKAVKQGKINSKSLETWVRYLDDGIY